MLRWIKPAGAGAFSGMPHEPFQAPFSVICLGAPGPTGPFSVILASERQGYIRGSWTNANSVAASLQLHIPSLSPFAPCRSRRCSRLSSASCTPTLPRRRSPSRRRRPRRSLRRRKRRPRSLKTYVPFPVPFVVVVWPWTRRSCVTTRAASAGYPGGVLGVGQVPAVREALCALRGEGQRWRGLQGRGLR